MGMLKEWHCHSVRPFVRPLVRNLIAKLSLFSSSNLAELALFSVSPADAYGLHNIAYGLRNIVYGLHNIVDGLHNITDGLHNILEK